MRNIWNRELTFKGGGGPEFCEIDPESDGIINKRLKVFIAGRSCLFNVFCVSEYEVVKLFVGEEGLGLEVWQSESPN